ncbi:MAG: tripartite tricarboxylate transporter substrate binding protein [Deltaproteobacteria bacterium]|nr:tripartite tricarboxylate transporter substrate binding protein [Deltaproteobacteria bacterium]
MKKLLFFMAIGVIAGLPQMGLADDPAKYPERPVTITGGYAAGGDTDLVGRAIAASIQKFCGQPWVVAAKPGGAGLVALQNLVSAKPDGYTLHLGRPAELTAGPLVEKYPFEVDKEFVPIAQVVVGPLIFTVNADVPWKTIEDVVAAAKKEPGKIKFSCASPVSTGRMALEKFCYETGIKMTAVPFKGGAPAAIATAGGHVQAFPGYVSEALPHTNSGKIRVLMVFTEKRVKEYPDVPTAKEKGYNINFGGWHTVIARKGTPAPILQKLETWLKQVTEEKDFTGPMEKIGSQVVYLSGQDFAKYWADEKKWMAVIVKNAGIKNE